MRLQVVYCHFTASLCACWTLEIDKLWRENPRVSFTEESGTFVSVSQERAQNRIVSKFMWCGSTRMGSDSDGALGTIAKSECISWWQRSEPNYTYGNTFPDKLNVCGEQRSYCFCLVAKLCCVPNQGVVCQHNLKYLSWKYLQANAEHLQINVSSHTAFSVHSNLYAQENNA